MYECELIHYHYMPTDYPREIKFPNDYKFPLAFDESYFGAKPIGFMCKGGELVCVDDGSYLQPASFDLDIKEILIVNPIMKCWGRGKRD